MIRDIGKKDVPELVRLGEHFWNESEMKDLGVYSPQIIYRNLFNNLGENLVGWVYEKENEILTSLICSVTLNFWDGKKQLSEIAWFSKKENRSGISSVKLIKCAEKYAKAQKIEYFIMGRIKGPSSYGKLGQFYEKLGFKELEQTFVKKYE